MYENMNKFILKLHYIITFIYYFNKNIKKIHLHSFLKLTSTFLHAMSFSKYHKLAIYYIKCILTFSLGLLTTNTCLKLHLLCIQKPQAVTLNKYIFLCPEVHI